MIPLTPREPHQPSAARCPCLTCRYGRHAERFGTADVFETAVRDRLRVEQLARLSLRLQTIDPEWTLPQSVRRALALALALADRGVDAKTICRIAMISRWTLNRALGDVVQVPESVPQPALQSGAMGAIQATLGAGSSDTDLLAARAAYATARAAYERAAREGDWDAVRELVKPAAVAANRAPALHHERRRVLA